MPSPTTDRPDLERVLCAAVWIDDGVSRVHQPVASGLVIGCWRHHQGLSTAADIRSSVKCAPDNSPYPKTQGFLTSHGRFVDRTVAYRIARVAGQVKHKRKETLFSEDLY